MANPRVIDVDAVVLSPAQLYWIESLSPSRRAAFDQLRIPAVQRPNIPSMLAWLLELAEAGPVALTDPIIAAEVEQILGPER